MAKKAIHVRTGRPVTPEQFIGLEGPGYREKGILPLCPQCDAPLSPYGVHSPHVASRFDHPDGSRCSLSSTPDERYAHLVPADWDLEQGTRLRSALCDDATRANLKAVYTACLALCGKLSGIELRLKGSSQHGFEFVSVSVLGRSRQGCATRGFCEAFG